MSASNNQTFTSAARRNAKVHPGEGRYSIPRISVPRSSPIRRQSMIRISSFSRRLSLEIPVTMRRFGKKMGLSFGIDEGYSKVIVITASLLSGLLFGPAQFLGILTAQWKASYGLPQSTASMHQRLYWGFFYFGQSLMSQLYTKFSPRVWLLIGRVFAPFSCSFLLDRPQCTSYYL